MWPFRRLNLNVVVGVADIGEFVAAMPLTKPKSAARFARAGQPDLMGNHLYVSKTDEVYLCGLRTNNGTLERTTSGSGFSWRGVVRYNSYKVVAPPGYVIVSEDGAVGPELVLHAGETLPFLPRATIQNRFAICLPQHAALAATRLAYADQEPRWQPLAGNYGPSELALPSVEGHNYESTSAAQYQQWLEAWRSGEPIAGNWESVGRRVGPKMPAGEPAPYAHGGNGIDPNHGYEQSRSNILLRRWKHARWMDRMNAAIFDPQGRQLDVNSFASPQQIAQIRGEGHWQWGNELPVFLVGDWANAQYPTFNPGPTDREEEAWGFQSVWISHYIRAIQNGIAVWEYTHDPMVADDLAMLFENMRLVQFADRGDEIEHDSSGYTPPSIRAYVYAINQWPRQGTPSLDRAYGWSMYLGAQLRRMGYPTGSWLRKMTIMGDKAMMPNGIVNRNYDSHFPASTTQGVQIFHEMIIAIGYHAACTQLRRSPANKLTRLCAAVLDNSAMPTVAEEYSPDGSVKGPPHWIWTHINNTQPVRIKAEHSNGGGDAAHVSQVLALTFLATQDPRWLNASLNNWVVAEDLQQKLAWLQATADKSWGGTLQAVLESQNSVD
jgi:hypothetical protein